MLTIDGSRGEGGGQILRSSLTLSLVTGRPFRIVRIRAGRPRPGLGRQHRTAVEAAAAIASAEVEGAVAGSAELSFRPRAVRGGDYAFDVGSAGSTTLVLQTVLPALLCADRPSRLVIDGGTHNPFAPPFEFVDRVFLPALRRMGARVSARLVRYGFYPAGGGRIAVTIEPVPALQPLHWVERGPLVARRACALVARLPRSIAERELRVVADRPGWGDAELEVREVTNCTGPGNVLQLEIRSERSAELVSEVGRKGLAAESVAKRAVAGARSYLETDAPVGEHLADQLVIPLALAGAGAFRTVAPSSHLRTNLDVVRRFLELHLEVVAEAASWIVRAGGPVDD